ncbi:MULTISPECIES: hypothetical protein [Micromonospora]|uniref:hypothetical protein n=1 Tax=Micromonospora TaxID=1873 RepID=UPI0033C631EC
MGHRLFAVLVRASASVATVDAHLIKPMRPLLHAGLIDAYRLGGQVTGAWSTDYKPDIEPRNWHTCQTCGATTRVQDVECPACADAVAAGRRPGTVLPFSYTDWARYPGDIVGLPRLLHPGWRFPPGRTPSAWVDLAGVVWLGVDEAILTGTDTGAVPPRLRSVFADLVAGRRNPDPTLASSRRRPTPADWSPPWRHPGRPRQRHARFTPADWSVAVVDAHS